MSCTYWHVRHMICGHADVKVIIQWRLEGRLDLFQDGQLVTSVSVQVASSCANITYNFGNTRLDYSSFYLDDFNFFDRQLTTIEISASYED